MHGRKVQHVMKTKRWPAVGHQDMHMYIAGSLRTYVYTHMCADGKSYMGLSHVRFIIIRIVSDPSSTHGVYGNI